jgi:hypothetical protein
MLFKYLRHMFTPVTPDQLRQQMLNKLLIERLRCELQLDHVSSNIYYYNTAIARLEGVQPTPIGDYD